MVLFLFLAIRHPLIPPAHTISGENSLGDSKGQTRNNLIHPELSYDNCCTGFVEFKKKKKNPALLRRHLRLTSKCSIFVALINFAYRCKLYCMSIENVRSE